jgi:hypothetical protein
MKRIIIYVDGHQEEVLVPDDVVNEQKRLFESPIYTVSSEPKDLGNSKVTETKP